MTRVFYADVSAVSSEDILCAAMKILPAQRCEKIKRLKFFKDKILSAASWLVLCEALSGFPGYRGDEIIAHTKSGKPFFENSSAVYFSISHSGDIALCSVSDKPTGADVQFVCDFKEGVCRRFFTKAEADFVFKPHSAPLQKENFIRMWTLKEAYAKMTGDGLAGFKHFEIQPEETAAVKTHNEFVPASFKEFDIPLYKASVCVCGDEDNFEFKKVNLYKLLIK